MSKSNKEILDSLREVLLEARGFETALAIVTSGQNATIVNGVESGNSQKSLITAFLLLAGVLRQDAKGQFKEALNHVLALQDFVESGCDQTRH